jgi:hypothetical protein
MKSRLLLASAALSLGAVVAHAANGPTYTTPDLVLTFENPSGTDLEFNLGVATALPSSGTVDFGNFASFLTSNGQTVSSTLWAVAADAGGATKGAPPAGYPIAVSAYSGTVNALPGAIWLSETSSNPPSPLSTALPAATLTSVEGSIGAVGTDISTNTALGSSGLAAQGVAVSATGDGNSYTGQSSYGNLSADLEVTGSGSSQFWLLTSTTPGTGSGKSATAEGPLAQGVDLGVFSLSNTGELTFTATAIPEPSTYAAILGVITVGFAALRRRRALV